MPSAVLIAILVQVPANGKYGMSADTVIKAVAVAIGAAWTVMNYVRGRTYRKRLDIDLTGSIKELDCGAMLFTGECKAKNLGSSEIPIVPEGTGIRFLSLWLRKYTDGEWGVVEELIEAIALVSDEAWIEPTETFNKPFAVTVPQCRGVFAGVRSETMINNGKTVWTVSKICEFGPEVSARCGAKEKADVH